MSDLLTSGIVVSLQNLGVDAGYQGRGFFRAGGKRFAVIEDPGGFKTIAVLSDHPRLLVDYGNPRMIERILVSIGFSEAHYEYTRQPRCEDPEGRDRFNLAAFRGAVTADPRR